MDQNSAFVSYLGDIIRFDVVGGYAQHSHDNEAAIFSQGEKKTLRLQAMAYRFSSQKRSFEEGTRSQTNLNSIGRQVTSARILQAKCVRESHTGLVLPCVLVQCQRGARDFPTSLFLFKSSSKRIFLLGEFSAVHAIPADNVWLIDGPSACWRVNEINAFLIARKDSESGKFRVDDIRDEVKTEENHIMYCSMDPDDKYNLLTIPQVRDSAEGNESAWHWTSLKCNSKHKPVMLTCKFVPQVYASIASCSLFTFPEQECDKRPVPQSTLSFAPPEKNTAYVATSMKQLLHFKNGVFCRLASIPFDDAVEIVSMETRGENVLIVRSKEGGVCVISCSSFQVVHEWKGVASIHIGDFLCNGKDQLLMLLNHTNDTPGPKSFPEFILTDLDLCLITSNDLLLPDGKGQRSDEGQSAPTPQSLVTAMQALEAKVQNGLTSLREQEMNGRMKDRIISQSMDNLIQMATGRCDPVQRQPTLVQLCGASSSHTPLAQMQGSSTGLRLKVTNGWQRIANQKWVIGCKVTNDDQWAVSDIKLLVIPWKINLTQESVGLIQHPSSRGLSLDASGIEPEEPCHVHRSKRTKLQDTMSSNTPDHRVSSATSSSSSSRLVSSASPLAPGVSCDVVATTSIPEFLESPVASCFLVLQWTRHSASPGDNHSEIKRQREVSVICGKVHLSASDLLENKLDVDLPEVDPTQELKHSNRSSEKITRVLSQCDELAMEATQLSTTVVVTSRYTPLSCLQSVLVSSMGFQRIGGNQAGGVMCLCDCTRGVLRGTRVYLGNLRSSSAQLRVCTRDKRDLMLFFHTLKSNIPVDVEFTLDTPTEHMEEAIKHCISCTSSELHHVKKITDLTSTITDMGVTNDGRDEETPMEEGDERNNTNSEHEKLKRLREDFLKQQQATNSKEYSLAGKESESLRLKLLNLRENTDNVTTALSKCISV